MTAIPRLKSFSKFADAATVLAMATAALYFWGYVYYRVFCERLGFRCFGLSIPFQDYLVVGWQTAFAATLSVIVLLGLFELLWRCWNWLDEWLKKKNNAVPKHPQSKPGLGYITFGAVALIALAVFFGGVQAVLATAQQDADAIRKEARLVIIRDVAGVEIKGTFVYLRDLGGALAVEEFSPDAKSLVGTRIFKQGSYGSYTLLASSKNTTSS